MSSSESESTKQSSIEQINMNKWENYISKNGELFFLDCISSPCAKNVKNEKYTNIQLSKASVASTSKVTNFENSSSCGQPANAAESFNKKFTNFSDYSEYYCNFFDELNSIDNQLNFDKNFCFVILSKSSGNTKISEDILFSYPKKEHNKILGAKGCFLTLKSIVKNDFKTELISSNLKFGDTNFNVFYKDVEKLMLILAFPVKIDNISTAHMFEALSANFFKLIEEIFIEKIMEKSDETVIRLLNNCGILNVKLQITPSNNINHIFNLTNFIHLSKDTEAKIYDALNEMEAMDYRDWNDEPLTSHREFFICGSMLYYNNYLIANQLPDSHAIRINNVLNFSGILDIIEKNVIQEFICWYEIPISIQQSQHKYFLAVCTRNNLTLACLLQTFMYNQVNNQQDQMKTIINPSLFYIEEIQDTLDYLNEKSIQNIARNTIEATKRIEITNKQVTKINNTKVDNNIKKHFIDDIKLPIFITSSSHSNHSQTHSEEDSNNRDEEYSEMDSEWDGLPNSFKSYTNSEIDKYSECKKSLLNKSYNDIISSNGACSIDKLFKRNGCFITNLIEINTGLGILISHIEKSDDILLCKFKSVCQLIHNVLKNSQNLNHNSIQLDSNSYPSSTNKYLNYIKEHGIQFTIPDYMGNRLSKFWVIGRLLDIPSGEFYVCHQEDIPENLIEIAFRLMIFD